MRLKWTAKIDMTKKKSKLDLEKQTLLRVKKLMAEVSSKCPLEKNKKAIKLLRLLFLVDKLPRKIETSSRATQITWACEIVWESL